MRDSRPIQIRGPPLNGTKLQSIFLFSHRSGLNSSASRPQRSLRLWSRCSTKLTVLPLGTKTGAMLFGPPPRGSVVSRAAKRTLAGLRSYRRSASRRVSCSYRHDLSASKVVPDVSPAEYGPKHASTAARSLANSSGCRARRRTVHDSSEAVVSRPARSRSRIWSRS